MSAIPCAILLPESELHQARTSLRDCHCSLHLEGDGFGCYLGDPRIPTDHVVHTQDIACPIGRLNHGKKPARLPDDAGELELIDLQ
jgi:hypothetical protein